MIIVVNCDLGRRDIEWPAVLPVPIRHDIVTIDDHDYLVQVRIIDPDPKGREHLVGLRVKPIAPVSAEGWMPNGD